MLYDTKWDEKLPTTTYKSAEELGISEAEHDALQQVMQMLESGEIVEKEYVTKPKEQNSSKVLWMATHKCDTACGTAACIGGWVCILMGVNPKQIWKYEHQGPLRGLYWGHLGHTTPKQAAQAIKNFLTTGDPNWQNALGK